jgi:hypothetical protein
MQQGRSCLIVLLEANVILALINLELFLFLAFFLAVCVGRAVVPKNYFFLLLKLV